MKHIKTLSLTLAFLMVLPLSYAAVGEQRSQKKSKTYYTAEQVDSIVATRVDEAVKSAVMRELNMELIELKIDKAANDKLGTYISEQNNQLTKHDIWLGVILTIFVGIAGIVVPLVINRDNNTRLNEIKQDVDNLAKQARESKEASEKSARESKFSEMLSQVWNEKDFNKQIEIVSQLIGEYPETKFSSLAYFARGTIYGNKGLYDKSIDDLSESIRRNPDHVSSYFNRGNAYYKKGEYDLAVADYIKSLKANPDDSSANNNLADVLCKLKRFDDALPYINRALEQEPDDSAYYDTRREVYEGLGKLKEALSDAKQSLEIAKRNGETNRIPIFKDNVKRLEDSLKK